MKAVPIVRQLIPVLLLGVLLGSGCPQGNLSDGPQIGWIRRGEVHIRVTEPVALDVHFEPTHGPADYAYLRGPDGRTIDRRRIGSGESATFHARLDRGPGIYTVIPSPSHRMRIAASSADIVFVPDTEFPSLFQRDDGTPWRFEVPEGCDAFTLASTNQNGWHGSRGEVRLYDPADSLVYQVRFDELDESRVLARLGIDDLQAAHYRAQGDTAEVPEFRLLIERHRVVAPAAGSWRVEAQGLGLRADDIGFWIEEIDAPLFPPGHAGFDPVLAAASATITVDPAVVRGPTGAVGTVWGWTLFRDEALDAYRELGLEASKHFFPQVDMEVENDNDDPQRINPEGFRFEAFRSRLDVYRDQTIPMTSLMTISRPAAWAIPSMPEITEFASAAVGYHQVELGLDPAGLYWQFLNEPNHTISGQDYVAAFKAVGERLARDHERNGREVRFGGPALGNSWEDPEAVRWDWIEHLITTADAELDFLVWNQYWLPRLHDTWRYATHIAHADSLLDALDSDGAHEEIVIGATNLRGGIVLQNEKQDGAHSALWWPSVQCHVLGTGRCSMLNYFFLIDQGARRKGFLRDDWSRKPVALASGFAGRHREGEVVASHTDHDGLDVLITRDPGHEELAVLVVNRQARSMELTVRGVGGALTPPAAAQSFDARTATTGAASVTPAADGTLRATMPPTSLLGFRTRMVIP